ncbi:MerR family transcriptional regulator [Motilibacter aurantiacus]|uniref:MerR family transcriptional regulator n=1 Tax=Motilibacter aurantiacus TaxID=2714955 RepID=UPI001E51C80F|nr:MerR family transcriptional regulator [Motilibacter aurantiacus]
MARELMRIGEAAERVGLSIRTLRHYEEVGIVRPSARSEGGFRLYTEDDLARLALVKPMKPLGFTLEEMRELLGVLDALAAGEDEAARARLAAFQGVVAARVQALRDQLGVAEEFARSLEQRRR